MTCPLCGNDNVKKIHKLCDNMMIMGGKFPKNEAYLANCQKCGGVFIEGSFTQTNLLTYYKECALAPNYYDMFGKRATEDYYNHILDLVKKFIDKKSKILDVAGSWGDLCGFFIDNGYVNIVDLDLNETCINVAEKKGIRCVKTDASDMSMIHEKMDLVIVNHTLEHILDIKNTMCEIRRIMTEDGYLFLEVPDVCGYAKENSAPFSFFTYEHVIHFSKNDLYNLAALYGFEVVEYGEYYKVISSYPCVYVIMKKGVGSEIKYSDQSVTSIMDYIEKSKKALATFVEPLRKSQEPLVLWGIGASTAIYVEAFSGCNVSMLVDRNPNRQGLEFKIDDRSYAITDPQQVGDETIVILSIPYRNSIEKQIRDMGLKNRIVTLG